jgi:heme exporter protein A
VIGPHVSLEVDDVELRRGERLLVSGLSFSLEPGQLALVTGPNGSGKTTLLRSIAGLSPPSAGEVRIGGCPAAALEAAQRAWLAYQGHHDGLKKDLTIEENLRINSEIRGITQTDSEVMSELGLAAFRHRYVRNLSAGQKRRVVLANLRLSGARLWLLDEPLTNLDHAGRALVADWLNRHLADDGIAVIATHLADVLRRPGAMLVEL